MINLRKNNRLREAIDTIKDVFIGGESVFYWVKVYKTIYKLSDSEAGFLIKFVEHGKREFPKKGQSWENII